MTMLKIYLLGIASGIAIFGIIYAINVIEYALREAKE